MSSLGFRVWTFRTQRGSEGSTGSGSLWRVVAGLANASGPLPPQHLHRLGQNASLHLQRAQQPGRRLPGHPDRQGN